MGVVSVHLDGKDRLAMWMLMNVSAQGMCVSIDAPIRPALTDASVIRAMHLWRMADANVISLNVYRRVLTETVSTVGALVERDGQVKCARMMLMNAPSDGTLVNMSASMPKAPTPVLVVMAIS